jgi:ubiquinone/menaquinone biosynthesis C-methylase UbiE
VGYDAERVAAFFDEYAECEWTRFESGPSSALSVAVHAHVLQRFIHAGDRVLDAGAGPGRFTIELAHIGASVLVLDVSSAQLELNRTKLVEAGLASSVEGWVQADITDLSGVSDSEFDAVVCFGGPISYVLEKADLAVAELLRVVRPGGHVLLSVMSLMGVVTPVRFLISDLRAFGQDAVQAVIDTGDLPSSMIRGHAPMHLYRWSELSELLRRHHCEIVAACSSGFAIGLLHNDLIADMTEEERKVITNWAIELAPELGAIDVSEHIIAVVRKAS